MAIVIAAYNADETLGAQLDALAVQQSDTRIEIVVVDNGSTDDTAAVIETAARRDARVRRVAATDGRGAGYARNVGVAETTAPWIAFCDADDVVGVDWVDAIVGALATHPFVTGPLDTSALNEGWLAGSRGTAISSGQPMFEGVFPIASSCNLAIHRELFDAHGGFDESFRIGQDTELSLRLWCAGVALHFAPAATVHYRYRATMRGVFGQARAFGRAQAAIEQRMRELQVDATPPRRTLRRLAWLIRSLPRIVDRAARARWLYVCGTLLGRAEARVRSN